jgi:hypothetical protein
MCGYTVKELKKIIMIYKKSNCPAISKLKRDELLKTIKDLNINVDEQEPLERKKKESKKKLIGNDMIGFINDPKVFLENIKSMYPHGYDNLKNNLKNNLKKCYTKDKVLYISQFILNDLKKPKFFTPSFLRTVIKSKSSEYLKDILASLFLLIDKKLLKKNIYIERETE